MSFCHLHLHSHFSLLDGANRIEDVVKRAAELQMPAVALTDHGNLFGAVQFHDAALRHGVKPIIGCEVYVARNGRKHREGRTAQANHLVLLATNETGYHNLVKLVSLGYLEGFYYRPRVDKDLIAQYSEGLICLSACLQGPVAWNLDEERYEAARKEAGEYAEIFGPGNFYLELQDHHLDRQLRVNPGIVRIARELGLPLVATNDCHYLSRDDFQAHDLLICIQTGKIVSDTNRLKYETQEFYFKTPDEMRHLFADFPEALENTLRISEKCGFGFGETQPIFPDFEVPPGYTVDSYFEKVVRDGFDFRLDKLNKKAANGTLRHPIETYRSRLENEIRVIRQMKFPAYFLIVWDFIRYARESGIPVGPGRGSAAGSLVSYSMQISDIDPLEYDLLFERFLNPERVSPPDIDIDFCMLRRGEVIDYVTHRYGRESVSHIITFGTMAARAAIKDVGRSLNIPFTEVNKIAQLVPQGPGVTLEKSLDSVKELQELTDSQPRYRDLVNIAKRLEGLSRHASIHAAGVVIAPKPLIELVPLYRTNRDEITTQYPMLDLERLGLLKMDFLGLTTLTLIEQALAQISQQLGIQLNLQEVPLDDAKTLKLFCDGRTTGIFQFESPGMRDILRRLQPSRFEDLIALNALYRPGPIQGGMIDDFINRRHGRVAVTYELPQLEVVLKETYGVIVYQEQVMQIASALAGFSLGEADLLRRAMGKKKKAVMEAQRRKFLDGAKARNIDAGKAGKIFDLMEQFAGYGFNKSHSAAYALLAYQTGYLKAHYPVQFMAALLSSEISNTDKILLYLAESKEMGLTVLPPDINASEVLFTGAGDHEIRFGLAGVKNVGEGAVGAIVELRRKEGAFKGFFEFCESVDLRLLNKRTLESLIKAGAFDCFRAKRKSMVDSLDRAIESAQKRQRDRAAGQRDLFGGLSEVESSTLLTIPDTGEWDDRERWAFEKEVLGFYWSGHPLEQFRDELGAFCRNSIDSLKPETHDTEVSLGGMINGFRKIQTKSGELMAAFQLEDLTGSIEVILWPKTYDTLKNFLPTGVPVYVRGRCEVDMRGEVKVIGTGVVELAELWKSAVRRVRIRIPVARLDQRTLGHLQALLHRNPGSSVVEFELVENGRYTLLLTPSETVSVGALPQFVREVEALFGEKSCILDIPF